MQTQSGTMWGTENMLLLLVLVPGLLGVVTAVLLSRIKQARPNEYMLVFRGGKLVRAGVGLRYFAGLSDVVVTMPAGMQKVMFRAQQVTSEMQGLEVQGMCVWSVFREGDGPAKAYRYLDGLSEAGIAQANANLKDMAESIVRSQIANMTISEVIRNRDAIRDTARKAAGDVVQGWGVWLETLEIYEVKILSASLFDNLQAAYREKVRLEAELGRIETETQLDSKENEARTHRQKAKQDAELEVARHNLEAMRERTAIEKQEMEAVLEMEKLRTKNDLEAKLNAIAADNAADERRAENRQRKAAKERQFEDEQERLKTAAAVERQALRAEAEREIRSREMEAERAMDATNRHMAALEAAREVFRSIGPGMRILSIGGPGGAGAPAAGGALAGVEALVPGMAALMEAVRAGRDDS